MTSTKEKTTIMDVVVDMNKCVGSGMCTTIAPDVFSLADDGTLIVLKRGVQRHEVEVIKDAIACCPVEAISFLEGSQ